MRNVQHVQLREYRLSFDRHGRDLWTGYWDRRTEGRRRSALPESAQCGWSLQHRGGNPGGGAVPGPVRPPADFLSCEIVRGCLSFTPSRLPDWRVAAG